MDGAGWQSASLLLSWQQKWWLICFVLVGLSTLNELIKTELALEQAEISKFIGLSLFFHWLPPLASIAGLASRSLAASGYKQLKNEELMCDGAWLHQSVGLQWGVKLLVQHASTPGVGCMHIFWPMFRPKKMSVGLVGFKSYVRFFCAESCRKHLEVTGYC